MILQQWSVVVYDRALFFVLLCYRAIISNPDNDFISSETCQIVRIMQKIFFRKTVLKEKDNINDGIGFPDLQLTICLFLAWLCIFAVLARGVHSSGKAAYFLALFPYVIMIALLIRAVTLEGAAQGILFFIKPNWSKLFEPEVWHAAITQCFFSLGVGFGGLITYSSYNDFRHNIYRWVRDRSHLNFQLHNLPGTYFLSEPRTDTQMTWEINLFLISYII